MFDCSSVDAALTELRADPRISAEYLTCIPARGSNGTLLLVGVVHDHPASIARVAGMLKTVTPEVLALELPPLAIPLFRRYAQDGFTPPRLGGEMSAAVQAAPTSWVVGIDAPNWAYMRLLAHRIVTERPPLPVIRSLGVDFLKAAGHAVTCWLGAVIGRVTRNPRRLYTHHTYGSSLLDPPTVQAEDESRHLATQRTFLQAVVLPHHRRLLDETREDYMATRLETLRQRGDVVAVVGVEHLQQIVDRLTAQSTSRL